MNHTSHLHRWFIESEKSKDSPYRKYYHWKPGKKDADRNRIPPTNWRGAFGGSTWEYSEKTDEYYLHLFTPQQPDLNWEIPEVRQAIYDEAITFWLDRGLDGFRVDTSALYSKHPFDDVTIVDPHNHDQVSLRGSSNGSRYIADAYMVIACRTRPRIWTEFGYLPARNEQGDFRKIWSSHAS